MHSKTTGETLVPRIEIIRFLVVTVVLGFTLQLVAVRYGVRGSGLSWLGLTMWAPTVGTVLAGPKARSMAWASIKRAGARYLPVALLLGWAPRLIETAWLAISGRGLWDTKHFERSADGRSIEAIHHLAMVLGVGKQSFAFFALNMALSITLGSVAVAVIGGIGEEIGWRGFLQPAFESRFGKLRGTLAVGAIWAYWHLPANLYGYNDSEHPLVNALVVFPAIVVAMAFGFAWLRERSKSAWPAALAHGANNTLGTAFILEIKGWSTNTVLDLVAMAIVASWFVWRAARASRSTSIGRIGIGSQVPSET